MKTLLRIILFFVVVLLVLWLGAELTDNGYLVKGLWASYLHGTNSASIDDARFFDTNTVEAGTDTWKWPKSKRYNKVDFPERLTATLHKTGSIAFLVIQKDSIRWEHYWDSYSDSSLTNSFSMAKSIVTMLAQIAIQKGIFKSWQQKAITILPEITGPYANDLELWHLSTMSSGLKWNEDYKNPFSVTAKAYYGDDIEELMLTLPIENQPGRKYNYQSGSTELLGLALIRATGKSLSELVSQWLWHPLHARQDATWHTDEQGIELAFCCFNSNARDFARFGRLMIHQGQWNGVQILDSSFVRLATTGALVPYYGYSFWLLDGYGTPVFYQRGFLGQYIITIPEYQLVIVRLGCNDLPDRADHHSGDVHVIVEEMLKKVRAS